MPGADPCSRALTPVEEAGLFSRDALQAANRVMAGLPPSETDAAYLAVYVLLAAAALSQGGALSAYPSDEGSQAARDVG